MEEIEEKQSLFKKEVKEAILQSIILKFEFDDHIFKLENEVSSYRKVWTLINSLTGSDCNDILKSFEVYKHNTTFTNLYSIINEFKNLLVNLNVLKSNMSPEETELLYKLLNCEDVFKSVEKYG